MSEDEQINPDANDFVSGPRLFTSGLLITLRLAFWPQNARKK
jgi:hypothetical protein